MRVLFQIRPNHESQKGGDTIHAVRTAEELRALGVEADVSGSLAPDLSGFDLVHLFNTELIEPTFRHTLRARAAGVPIVLTPIYWRPPLEDLRYAEIDRANLRRRNEAMRAIAFGLADALLPSSQAEAERIAEQFTTPEQVEAVPVGVDTDYAAGDSKRFCRRHRLPERGFVLCAARTEERKNQLRLIEACAPLGIPLVLAGAEYEDRQGYADACRALAERAGADVRFLGDLGSADTSDALAAARVHALPSLWETVGLASLEAAMAGCNVVSTDRCGVREYLGELAWYCDPESVESIRQAVAAAWETPLDERLREHVSTFTWRRAAERTLVEYEAVLRRREAPEVDWRETLSPEQYVEHLESLVQLQLETIALRDGHYAGLRNHAEHLAEHAQRLEEELGKSRETHYAFVREQSGRAVEPAHRLRERLTGLRSELGRRAAARLGRR